MTSGYDHQNLAFRDPIEEAHQLELRRRVQASGYMLIFAMAITGAMALIALTGGDIWQASALFGVGGVILAAYITINLIGPSRMTPVLVGILLLVLYFYLLLSGGVNNTGLMWAVMLVPGFINLYGYKRGTGTLIAVGSATALILFYPDFPGLTAEYDTAYRARFIAVFGALTALTALLDSSRHQTQQLLQRLTQELESRASTDALTGLANRREAYRAINELERRNRHLEGRYAVLIGDLDNFKRINDTYGHAFGDRVLQDVAQVLRDNTRADDIVARWGGEEFLVLLPNTDLHGGGILAEKLRDKVEALSGKYDPPVTISISFGVAEGDPTCATHGQLLAEADARMYRAKDAGRNKVMAV
ncbi:diguanylate cyclase (GGDEF) domain-containing protein [Microbulbifer donghaiensis]|uniref:diguanylate cyclase n=1 Tax=Microbulbifer donghaiensis TaxID=494016 RepID=A0A1M5A674_9GAMM|nr:GGDEF domain-containing protein [Microbulbifer donghaiensis]SHF25627.1 diguanylate cyclase (GGDEF) domain-containing protein [Microbulbifer donghaiensis]